MPYGIIDRLKQQGEIELLQVMESNVEKSSRARNKQHQVWEVSFDWKYCDSEKFIVQKLDYFHDNPCRGKWNLCNSPVGYKHSSAKFYLTGEQGVYPVTSYAFVMGEVDLTK